MLPVTCLVVRDNVYRLWDASCIVTNVYHLPPGGLNLRNPNKLALTTFVLVWVKLIRSNAVGYTIV